MGTAANSAGTGRCPHDRRDHLTNQRTEMDRLTAYIMVDHSTHGNGPYVIAMSAISFRQYLPNSAYNAAPH